MRHLLVGTANRSEAEATALAGKLRARIVGGEKLADLARTLSDDPGSRERGGDLGWIRPGATVPEFERAAFALTPAAPLSQPIRSQYGVHLLELVEKRDATVKPYEEVRLSIAMKLAEQYADTLGRKRAEALRADAKSAAELLHAGRAAQDPDLVRALVRGPAAASARRRSMPCAPTRRGPSPASRSPASTVTCSRATSWPGSTRSCRCVRWSTRNARRGSARTCAPRPAARRRGEEPR